MFLVIVIISIIIIILSIYPFFNYKNLPNYLQINLILFLIIDFYITIHEINLLKF